jgi:hypothetical protein
MPDVLVQAASPLGAEGTVGAGQFLHHRGHIVRVLQPHVSLKVATVVRLIAAVFTPEAAIGSNSSKKKNCVLIIFLFCKIYYF